MSVHKVYLGKRPSGGGGGGGGYSLQWPKKVSLVGAASLYKEAPPERDTFFRLQAYKRVGISQAEI